ncbi:LON peptidase N-terminal domain and RING finger protein 1 [Onthophagus taurus]|uniref:LON peptidase N-terminal domain and RING finger protein 1 n=1 Tax=Onthophagus taurus TaxID=166361 RepID=UPI000C20F802|nr:LON peptidase N-terminal domain and RING finger protein 1 [Onthophagus taurus]
MEKNVLKTFTTEKCYLRTTRSRTKKLKNYRKSRTKFRLIGSCLMDAVMETNRQDLFTCPFCRRIINVPVTIRCGHTFCYDCLNGFAVNNSNRKCSECLTEIDDNNFSVNVLVQDFVDKWRERNEDYCENDVKEFLGLEPRYCLRSRYAGLSSKNGLDEDNIHKIFKKFFRKAKRYSSTLKTNLNRLKIEENISWGNEFVIGDNNSENDSFKYVINTLFSSREQALKEFWCHVTISDLECILCSQCYLDPITTACGHTFCRDCLARVVDHGLACPLCMAPLSPNDLSRGSTKILDQAMRIIVPSQYEERLFVNTKEIHVLEHECEVPVFVCTNAFPGVACPLYVYEPRYRLLARRCLQSSTKQFAMAGKIENDLFASFGTILEVKDAVHLHDGRSILTTVGVRRFKVLDKGEKDGYDTAKVQFIRDTVVSNEKLTELINLHQRVHNKAVKFVSSLAPRFLIEIESSIGQMPRPEENWFSLPDGPSWAWWLMPILPLTTQLQVGFLSTTSLEKRLRAIDKMLEHMKVKMKALERNTLKCNDSNESSDSCRFWLI